MGRVKKVNNNGYDNVFVNDATGEVWIDEAKQWAPVLSAETLTNPKQMSDAWIRKVADKIKTTDPTLANKIEFAIANNLLIKTVTAVKKTEPGLGSIVTIKVQ